MKVEAAVAAMICRVVKKNAPAWWGTELGGHRGADVGVAEACVDKKLVVAGWCAKEDFMWCHLACGATQTSIDLERYRVQGLSPKGCMCCAVNQQSSQTIINRAQNAFHLAVLLRCIRAGEAAGDVVGGKDGTQRMRVVFAVIIYLQVHDRESKLCLNVSMKFTNNGENFGLCFNWKSPNVVSKII